MQASIENLLKFGPFPPERDLSSAHADTLQQLLEQIKQPITDEEAEALLLLFGPDDCFGIAWSLVHIIESAPNWPLPCILSKEGDWIELLKKRSGL